jgi:hypothetical protein
MTEARNEFNERCFKYQEKLIPFLADEDPKVVVAVLCGIIAGYAQAQNDPKASMKQAHETIDRLYEELCRQIALGDTVEFKMRKDPEKKNG